MEPATKWTPPACGVCGHRLARSRYVGANVPPVAGYAIAAEWWLCETCSVFFEAGDVDRLVERFAAPTADTPPAAAVVDALIRYYTPANVPD